MSKGPEFPLSSNEGNKRLLSTLLKIGLIAVGAVIFTKYLAGLTMKG